MGSSFEKHKFKETTPKSLELWQASMVTTAVPPDEPQLMTDAIVAYLHFGSTGLRRHFSSCLEMAAGYDFWDNWATMTDLVEGMGIPRDSRSRRIIKRSTIGPSVMWRSVLMSEGRDNP